MRPINRIILHCTATPEGKDFSAKTIESWHKARGFNSIGYHYLVRLGGESEKGRPISIPGAHTRGHNSDSIGIAYVGGVDKSGRPKDTRNKKQKREIYRLIEDLLDRFPGATVHGHNEFSSKACPSFDAALDWERYLESKSGFSCKGCCQCKGVG